MIMIALLAFAGASRAGAQQAHPTHAARPATTVSTTSAGQIGPEAYPESRVEEVAEPLPGSGVPGYPAALAQARVEGRVLAEFIVDTTGRVELDSFRAIESTNAMFTEAVRAALAGLRYRPATIGGRPVRQIVQQPFVFSLDQ